MLGTSPLYFEDLSEGYVFGGSAITVTEAHIVTYAGLTGDFYKLHMDQSAAEGTRFGARIAHGPFTFALTIGQLAQRITHLDIQAEAVVAIDNLRFLGPVFFQDTLTPLAEVTALRRRETNGAVTFAMVAENQRGEKVFTGEFTLLVTLRQSLAGALVAASGAVG